MSAIVLNFPNSRARKVIRILDEELAAARLRIRGQERQAEQLEQLRDRIEEASASIARDFGDDVSGGLVK